ncbi:MAG: iron chelate uptake ABC transporter family permease subunit [Flavobacteriaceae bacterium]|nr:iron chelate uptake ABC transporter family permease subunit [Flavobacteriaceae bacterium]
MNLQHYFQQLSTDYTLLIITLGTGILGGLCGFLGSFAVLKKQSLLGDAISHAALPGICLAFLIAGVKDTHWLLLGALVSGIIGTVWIQGIVSRTYLKQDTALGLILSLFFGFGLLLLTFIQKMDNANQAGLDKYLFGQAATLMAQDVQIMLWVSLISLFAVLLFWKEFKILLFDIEYAKTIGLPTKYIDIFLTSLIVLVIVMGLQTVGVVLMSALILAPAAAARQWTNKLWIMVLLATLFGALSGISGTALSASYSQMPTGPVIVLSASVIVLFSFIFSPKRGILMREIRFRKSRRAIKLNKALSLMYRIASKHENVLAPHGKRMLNDFKGYSNVIFKKLEQQGLINYRQNSWSLTEKGFEKAANLYNQLGKDE